MKSVFLFAKPEAQERMKYLCPAAMLVLADVLLWASEKGLHLVVTDTVTDAFEDAKLNRMSDTHRTCRAFDISCRDLNNDYIEEMIRVFSQKYRYLAATDAIGTPVLCKRHNAGTGDHVHFQVNKRYSLKENKFNKYDNLLTGDHR